MTTYYSNSDKSYRLTYIVDEVSTSVADNSSQVRFRLYLTSGTNSYAQYSFGGYAWVGAKYDFNAPSSIGFNGNQLLIDKTIRVPHDSNGDKIVVVAAKLLGPGGYAPGTLTIPDQQFKLTKLSRASTVSVSSGYFGDALNVNINQSSSGFTHDVRYNVNGITGVVASDITGSTTFKTSLDWASTIPNATSTPATIYVDTKSNGSVIGTSTGIFYLTVPDNVKPKISSLSLSDTNQKASTIVGANNFVQIISNPIVTFNGASGAYDSTIQNFNAEVVGKNQSTQQNGGPLGIFNFSGKATIKATVTDSRGRVSDPVTTEINVIPYSPPAFSFTVTRAGAKNDNLVVTRNAKISPLIVDGVQKNKMTLTFKTAPLNTTSFTIDTSNASGTYTTVAELINSTATLSGSYGADKSFDVYGLLSDVFSASGGGTPVKQTVSTESFPLSWHKNSAGIGTLPKIDDTGSLNVAGNIYSDGKPIQQKQLALNNGGSFRHDTTDLNTLQDTGFYCVFKGDNRPTGAGPGYVTVVRHETANYAYQQFYDRTNKTIFTRLLENGVWSGWSEYVKKDSLQTTGWITIGNGFKYKRKGDDIDLMYNFASNGLQRWSVGNMPSGLIPQELMFAITGWTLAPDKSIHLQINASGLIECINPGAYSNTYRGVVHWSI
ncbi:TPA: hypothetical protein U9D65_000615 [Streptococcus agalactiae]|uniref:DUF859 family phage minor structural protein n=1 Tax=Streptococcus agalactiae TaxID=1311 RepID=UPI00030E724B|nr:DUF859 family phage minor structural protein [Streptococcus agalactiae]EPX17843.1 hypothetical protein SAG0210_01425 [Streptococcus agalactiae str. Gottschalk 13227]MCW1443077.1 DUF859 domain-containing protein [Streptococcus agalactiae]MCW1451828.1 DUF859 domain-containing protein [Streptococcus agalactiae]OCL53190.1 hypothetical protein AX268_03660 [Streptococcus agalactiae]UJB47675.1 hypothetical protein HQ613_03385 [Streptococcus agalactiae]